MIKLYGMKFLNNKHFKKGNHMYLKNLNTNRISMNLYVYHYISIIDFCGFCDNISLLSSTSCTLVPWIIDSRKL